jgi:hypothetical protein
VRLRSRCRLRAAAEEPPAPQYGAQAAEDEPFLPPRSAAIALPPAAERPSPPIGLSVFLDPALGGAPVEALCYV